MPGTDVGVADTGPGPTRRVQTVATIALVVVVATAVALILAQSAGAVHLGFLGPVS